VSDAECIHGMTAAWCAACRTTTTMTASPAKLHSVNRRSDQRLFDDLCEILGVARYVPGPGSSPSRVFEAAAVSARVKAGSMPEVGSAIATKAGLSWGTECDNRRKHSGATVVTREGLEVVLKALEILSKKR
jgi:hypothetical protein